MVWLWDFRKTYNRGQTLQKTKKTRLHVDKEIYKTARYNVENLIAKQKKKKRKQTQDCRYVKYLRKALESLGIPNESDWCIVK